MVLTFLLILDGDHYFSRIAICVVVTMTRLFVRMVDRCPRVVRYLSVGVVRA